MKMVMFLLAFVMVHGMGSCAAVALSQSQLQSAEYGLNQSSPGAMQKHRLGSIVTKGVVHIAKAKYDFAVQGGSTGLKILLGDNGQPVVLPSRGVVIDCLIDVQTPGATSTSGTIAIGTGQSSNDLKTATAAASFTGLVACTPVGTAATAIKLTADRTVSATIANTVSAGKFNVLISYVMSD